MRIAHALTHAVADAIKNPDTGTAYIARVARIQIRKGGLTIYWRITAHKGKNGGEKHGKKRQTRRKRGASATPTAD